MKKKILGAVSIVLVLCVAVGATLAYLFDTTEAVVNTFSFGNVNITLTEEGATLDDGVLKQGYKIIPGDEKDKNPLVTVTKGSEEAYVFVEVLPSANLDTFVTYTVNTANWIKLDGVTPATAGATVYAYKETVDASEADANVELDEILTAGKVQIKTTFDEADQEALQGAEVTLTFKAYAIQAQNVGGEGEYAVKAATAWTEVLGELA